MENQNAAMGSSKRDGTKEENPRKKQRMEAKLRNFKCTAHNCTKIITKYNIENHLIRNHQAAVSTQTPVSNTISWQVNLKREADHFYVCMVPQWGMFILREMRQRHENTISSRMCVQYLGYAEKAGNFQYQLLHISETNSVSVTGNVEHLFVEIPAQKTSFTLDHGDFFSPEVFRITIRKKNKSGNLL